jgi:hypothetical protein
MIHRQTEKYIITGILVILLVASGVWYAFSPTVQSPPAPAVIVTKENAPLYTENYVVVDLKDMQVELRNGTTTLRSFPVLSKGKPGSYYETIGGTYVNDYKIKTHYSTLGEVYMPWSTHVFGQFFIHGIPYYPNGTDVASTYSGGCIRLSNDDARQVYEFVDNETPIVVTEHSDRDFIPTATTTPTLESMDMTRFMVATVSLEVLTQDDRIKDTDNLSYTTRKTLLPRLIVDGDDSVSRRYAEARGEATFVEYMNKKAQALGLTNTSFTSVLAPASTTPEEQDRFMQYIAVYKTYLLGLAPSTEASSR